MMADRRSRMRRRALLLAPLAALAAAHLAAACTTHCDGGVCTDSSEARFIDRVCRQRATEGPICEVDGGAVQTTGLTGDTLGFHLGDAGGTLTIHLQALEGVRQGDTFDIELLMASTDPAGSRIDARLDWGSCGEGCPQNPPIFDTTVTPDYHWVAVEIGQLTATTNLIPYDATLRLEGKSIDIADLRVSSISPE
ncbi:MAG: hypothetical protein U0359_42005, partial [Byssovorax sp.]